MFMYFGVPVEVLVTLSIRCVRIGRSLVSYSVHTVRPSSASFTYAACPFAP